MLAHELRNPLAPIRSGVAALRLALPDDATLRRVGGIIERQVRQMSRLLDDLLDVSRITHNKLELRMEPLTLQAVLDSALETSRPLLETARPDRVAVRRRRRRCRIVADPMRIAQVFANLISNASKYSHAGAVIRIGVTLHQREVAITVSDDGIGIAAEALPTIFDVFSQASQARTRAQGGVGIGLSLVKGLVELHGGRVSAQQPRAGPGQHVRGAAADWRGSRRSSAVRRRQIRRRSSRCGRRVVIADDNRDGADSLALVVRAFGCDVRTAYDGAGAVRRDGRVPAARRVPRSGHARHGRPRGRPPHPRAAARLDGLLLVAVTGWGQERDRQQTSEAGFDAHVVKPADPFALRALIARDSPSDAHART